MAMWCHGYGNSFAQKKLCVCTVQCVLYTSNCKKRAEGTLPVLLSKEFLKDEDVLVLH